MLKLIVRIYQKGSTQILVLILIVILGISGFLYFRNYAGSAKKVSDSGVSQDANSGKLVPPVTPKLLTYTNSKYSFSIQYPDSLVVREFPDTGDGAGFRPVGTAEDPGNEVITVQVLERNAAMADDPLSDYAKTAATLQIQNYEKLNSITPVRTNSGLTGYKTTWMVAPMPTLNSTGSGQLTVSEPLTYFDLKLPSFVMVSLSDSNYASDYEAIIKSFDVKGDR